MNKESIYITLINTFLGISTSLLIKSSTIITFVIASLAIGTILFIERKWINEKIFRQNKWYAIAAYSSLVVLLIGGLFFATKPDRETSLILKSVHVHLNAIKAGNYRGAYGQLSSASKKNYPLDYFIKYHSNHDIKIQDFTIDRVMFNQYDDKKAQVVVTSPFLLYGREKLEMEMIKENEKWCVVLSKVTIPDKTSVVAKIGEGKKRGAISNFFRKLF